MEETKVEISFFDTKEIEEDGEIKTIASFIPDCCRLGLPSCPHVSKPIKIKNQGVIKNNAI